MPVLPLNLDYTDKDFDSLRYRLIEILKVAFPDWTDFEAGTFSNVFMELMCHVGDVILACQDNQAKEAYLTDAKLRQSVISIVNRLGYTAKGSTAATADILIALTSVPINDVTIPAGTIVRTKNVTGVVSFQLLTDLTIASGTNPPQGFVTVEHSENYDEEFVSTGLANQSFELSGVPYLDNSLVLFASNGVYTQVDNFLDSTSVDLHYRVDVDANDRAKVVFGNGVNGVIPAGVIVVSYKIGGGTVGNVDANTITEIVGSFTDSIGNGVDVSVNNPVKAAGGADRETAAQIKIKAVESIRVSDRTVAREDYEIGARSVPGVARALMLTSDQAVGLLPENRGYLYVVPIGGGSPSQVLKDAVLTAVTVTKPNTVTFRVEVKDPIYLPVNVDATVYLKPGYTFQNVAGAIRDNLTGYFAIQNSDGTPNENINFGFGSVGADGSPVPEIPLSDVFNVVRDTVGVRKVGPQSDDIALNGAHEDLALYVFDFPILGSVTIRNGDTGEVLVF